MRHIILIILLSSTQALSQSHLDYGPVIADKTFSCDSDEIRREGTTNTIPAYSTSLETICQSKNELEIRFYLSGMFDWYLYVLTYSEGNWTATEYWYDLSRKSHDKLHPIKVFNLKPYYGFDSLFEKLKHSEIFTLPDAFDFNYETDYAQHWCGFLTFKANDKLRRYRIKYPEDYKERYPYIKEFEYYDSIMETFLKDLKRE